MPASPAPRPAVDRRTGRSRATTRGPLPRGRSALLALAAVFAAAGLVADAARATGRESAPSALARVMGAAAGSVGGRVGGTPGRRAAASGTFAGTTRGVDVGRPERRGPSGPVRRQLELLGAGTYIGELLAQRDSALTRWPDRGDRPLAVYVGSGAGLPGWEPAYARQVASAFAAWRRAGVPLEFRLTSDSARADVHVTWIDRFAQPISGRTVWSRDDRWWMLDGNIVLALHHSDGVPLDADQVRAIALHEVGHLLGLDHTRDPSSVMASKVRVRELSAADAATARLLYAVPAGRVR